MADSAEVQESHLDRWKEGEQMVSDHKTDGASPQEVQVGHVRTIVRFHSGALREFTAPHTLRFGRQSSTGIVVGLSSAPERLSTPIAWEPVGAFSTKTECDEGDGDQGRRRVQVPPRHRGPARAEGEVSHAAQSVRHHVFAREPLSCPDVARLLVPRLTGIPVHGAQAEAENAFLELGFGPEHDSAWGRVAEHVIEPQGAPVSMYEDRGEAFLHRRCKGATRSAPFLDVI